MPGSSGKKTGRTKVEGDVTSEYEQILKNRKNEKYRLRLYIAGNNPRSQLAVENVKKICEEYLKDRYQLEVIVSYKDRTKSPADLVLAAPTLIKKLPMPLRRIIGDMTRKEKVLVGLDLLPQGT
ncbi:MAG TPA: circadian clock KaiB family protein [Methanoregula sp.]|nr:circadian clock KaiB family protein [Methanoregula sp.]